MDEVDRLYDTRDGFDRAAQALGAAAVPTGRPYEGTDESGEVRVRLTPEGHLDDVRVGMGWRSRLGADALPAAVQDAIARASAGRLEDWGHGLDTALSGPPAPLRPAPALYDTLAGQLEDRVRSARTPAEIRAVEAALVEVMDELLRSVDEATAEVDAVLTETVRGESGRDRHVVVELTATGEVTTLTYDDAWLQRAHAANIGRETMLAVTAARRALTGRTVADAVAGSRLNRLQTMLNDPDAVAARLGL
ncbi:hypothetical protein [Phycicoccus duodecadis]|uniref:YbaB/EbfC DNA-binding family protein n=1 Tax=Phycicoccus duodecadis TaxID=173053 RepID=A0A2N3YMM1_9MICO|nr:hypothetical protein [Phycicoccus duodecadis]PKW28115.1 hypothetical protein ATL31_2971 [Phycicoccus duodecadis]